MIAWLVLQATVAGPPLNEPPATRACPAPSGGDIVVCGRGDAQERFRLRPLDNRYEGDAASLPRAETAILGGRAGLAAEVEATTVGGVQSNRAMVRLKIPLGK